MVKVGGGGLGSKVSTRSDGRDESLEMEPQASLVERMTDKDIVLEFEKMLENMNLTEEKKEPLRRNPISKKKEMLIMHLKNNARTGLNSPEAYIQSLVDEGSLEPLRVSLTSNSLEYIEEFGVKGLHKLLGVIQDCLTCQDLSCEKLHLEGLKCLKAIMNNKVGLKNLFDHSEALILLARSILTDKPMVALEAVKLLAAVCLIPPSGHDKTLEAITRCALLKHVERFQSIVQGLWICNNQPLKVASMTLINALVSCPEDLDFRLHLRNEFMRSGLREALAVIGENPCEELHLQLKVFEDYKDEDYDEFTARFDSIRLDLDDVGEVFELVRSMCSDTAAEPYLLSIIQHLLCVRDDFYLRPAYFKLIEECVSQIVLHKSGCDPDFRSTSKFEIDVEPLVDHLVDRAKTEEANCSELSAVLPSSLEAAITEKQELEAQLATAQSRIEELEATVMEIRQEKRDIVAAPSAPPPPPPPPPPAPPAPASTVPSPPPPPSASSPAPDIFSKLGLKRKKKWVVEGQIKRTNWKMIPLKDLTEKAVWARLDEERLATDNLVVELQNRFGSKTSLKLENHQDLGKGKKIKELKFLDAKSAQNLSVVQGGSLKHISYSAFRSSILQCDTSVLTESLLQTLIQYLPPAEELARLSQFKTDYESLAEVEKFVISLSDLNRLVPRLKALMFKIRFPEFVQDCKPSIVAVNAACEEIKKSAKFARILELVLLIGNIMNTGSRLEQCVGFDISHLPKLSNTKDKFNQSTLLHFLVEKVELDQPDLLNFDEEMIHLDAAAKVSLESIDKVLKQMEVSLGGIETDLEVLGDSNLTPGDNFKDVMSQFSEEASSQLQILTRMRKNLGLLYTDLAEYFVFDGSKYGIEEFFRDIKHFKEQFKKAQNSIREEREASSRAQRARAAREKSMRDKSKRNNKKLALVESALEDPESRVVDCLLEALKTGSAFSREEKRKRQVRPEGAARRAQLDRTRSRARLSTSGYLDSLSRIPTDTGEVSRSCLDVRNVSSDCSTRLLQVPGLGVEGRGRSYSEDLDRIYTATEEQTLIRKLREL